MICTSKIRSIWDENSEEWFFAVVDIAKILTNQSDYQMAKAGHFYFATLEHYNFTTTYK